MTKWLELVGKARRSLGTRDATERVVYFALEEAPEARLDTTDMVLVLEAEEDEE